MVKDKLRHRAISVPDKEKAAKFYEETFGFERVSQSRVATRLSNGVMNITLLQFETEEDAGDERGKDFVGLHHFGVLMDDIDAMKETIEAHGGKYHPGPTDHARANAEHKFRDPYGIVFDISTHGWDGAARGAKLRPTSTRKSPPFCPCNRSRQAFESISHRSDLRP